MSSASGRRPRQFYDGLWRAGADGENRSRWRFQAAAGRPRARLGRRRGVAPCSRIGPGPGREAARLIARRGEGLSRSTSPARRSSARGRPTAGAAGVVQAAAEALPLASGSIDVVFTQTVLMHLDLAAAAAEWARVLRPGGRVVVARAARRQSAGRGVPLVLALSPDRVRAISGSPSSPAARRRSGSSATRRATCWRCWRHRFRERSAGGSGRSSARPTGCSSRCPALRRFAWMALVELRRG